jgi:coniferyl-aldehyde dehydrogenase
MNANDLPLSEKLQAALALQRKAYLAHPVPNLDERKQRPARAAALRARDHKDALCDGHQRRLRPPLARTRRCWPRWHRRSTASTMCSRSCAKLDEGAAPHVDCASFPAGAQPVVPQPLGVVGVIVPWNFPLNLSVVPLTYIFAAGNRAMVKMSENSRRLARLLIEKLPAYFPPEKLQFFDETGGVGVAFSRSCPSTTCCSPAPAPPGAR